jgi:hypothetical protein
MREAGKKWLLWSNFSVFCLSLCSVVISILFPAIGYGPFYFIGIPVLVLSGLILTVLLVIRFQDHKYLRLTSNISAYLFPLFIFMFYIIGSYFKSDLPILFCSILAGIFTVYSLINIFLFREAGEIKGILILLLLTVVSFVMLRISILKNRLPNPELVFVFLTLSTGFGMLIFGFRCLFKVEKNSYLKYISLIACLLIAYGSIVFIGKMLSAKANVFELIYFIPAFLLTIFVLFSLPLSGFIHWSTLHKRILTKIMISWIFFLLVFSVNFVFPDLFQKIVFKEKLSKQEFNMIEYKIINKNGLEPD